MANAGKRLQHGRGQKGRREERKRRQKKWRRWATRSERGRGSLALTPPAIKATENYYHYHPWEFLFPSCSRNYCMISFLNFKVYILKKLWFHLLLCRDHLNMQPVYLKIFKRWVDLHSYQHKRFHSLSLKIVT